MEEKLEAELIQILDESPSVKRFFFKILNRKQVDFKPGQFVIVDFPGIPHEFEYRSYSIASAPSNDSMIELCVVLKEEGCASPLLFKSQIGDRYTMSLPQGRFVLPDELEKDLCFICTGTGVAPFRSMVLNIFNQNKPRKNIYMYFGGRTQADLLYREEFEALAKKHSEFHYFPVLSREDWDGKKGYVHPQYLEQFEDKRPAYFYICGWTNMVREAKNNLKDLGYDRRSIKIELYD